MSPEAARLLRFAMDYPHTFHTFSPGNSRVTKYALKSLAEMGLVEIVIDAKGVKQFRARPSRLIQEQEFNAKSEAPKGNEFLIIGVYDDGQRFAESYQAETPEAAEAMAPADLDVAGVVQLIDGKMQVVA